MVETVITAYYILIYCYASATKLQGTDWVDKCGPTPRNHERKSLKQNQWWLRFFDRYRDMVYTHTVPQIVPEDTLKTQNRIFSVSHTFFLGAL